MILKTSYKMKPPVSARLIKGHPLARGIVGCWLFNEGSGNKVFDLSGNGNTGLFGTGTNIPTWKSGKFGPATSFDGDDHINMGNVLNMGTDSWTWIFSIKVDVYADSGIIWEKRGGDAVSYFQFKTALTGFQFLVHDGTNLQPIIINESSTDYIHFAVVYDRSDPGTGFRLYQNSILYTADLEQTVTASIVNTKNYAFGRRVGAGNGLQGILDYGMSFNCALSASEIAQLYREPFCMFDRPMDPLFSITAAPPEIQALYMDLSTQLWTIKHSTGLFTKL